MSTAGLSIATPTDTTILFTRTFNAQRPLVWDAMTNPKLVQRWMFCPPGWTWSQCEMDVRVGGNFLWSWNGPDGRLALSITGEYREVVQPSRIVHTEIMKMGPGAGPCGDEDCGSEPWELLATLELVENHGVTTMKMTLSFGSKEARDGAIASGMEHGMEAGYKSLDVFFASQPQR